MALPETDGEIGAAATPDAPQTGAGADAGASAWSRHDPTTWLPGLDDRSPNPWVCPFLRSIDDEDLTAAPVEAPDAANRCAALREPVPQSLRQQELVCLTSGHVNCPRYLRGALTVAEIAAPVVRSGRSISPAILGSVAVLVLAFAASVGFVLSRGGLELAAAAPAASSAPSASAIAAATSTPAPTEAATPGPTPAPTEAPTPAPTSAPTATPTPTPEPTDVPTAVPTPEATPDPTPERTRKPEPTSDRYALLDPCPDRDRCWIYTIRRGDNLYSIANYFGVRLQTVYDWNPWTQTTSLRAGQRLRLPPPTR